MSFSAVTQDDFNSALKDLVRRASQYCLPLLCKDLDFHVVELPKTATLSTDRISLIAISGAFIKVVFRVHFDVAAAGRLSGSDAATADATSRDFMNEYCNLTAGGIQKAIEGFNGPMAIGIPLSTVGRTQEWPPREKEGFTTFDRWRLVYGGGQLACSALFKIAPGREFGEDELRALAFDDFGGKLEFL